MRALGGKQRDGEVVGAGGEPAVALGGSSPGPGHPAAPGPPAKREGPGSLAGSGPWKRESAESSNVANQYPTRPTSGARMVAWRIIMAMVGAMPALKNSPIFHWPCLNVIMLLLSTPSRNEALAL